MAAPDIGSVPFLASLLAAEMLVEEAILGLILKNMLIDSFVTNDYGLLISQPMPDLLKTPVLLQQTLDQAPVLRRETVLSLDPATVNRQLIGLPGMIASQASAAPNLTTDRGRRTLTTVAISV